MNRRIAFNVLLTISLFLVPATSHARWMNANTGRFQTMDSFEGDQVDPLSLHKYLYCSANPLNIIDPSGHDGDLVSLQVTMTEDMKVAADVATSVFRAYNKARSVLDTISMIADLTKAIDDGTLTQVFTQIESGWVGKAVNFSGEEAIEKFGQGFEQSLPYAITWAPQLLVDMNSGNNLNSYLIYLPTPVKTPQVNIPTGLEIGGRKVQLVAGGEGSGRLLGLGIQVGNKDKQFMRMDFHKPWPTHGNPAGTGMLPKANDELTAWVDKPFHFHVLQYNGQSNR